MRSKKETLTGYAFITPALLTFVTLILFPFLFTIFLSFTEWNFLSGWDHIKFVGLKNFVALATDKRFKWGVSNTLIYTVSIVPVSIILALILAYLLNDKVYMKKSLRLCFFIPYISNSVALAAVFKLLFRDDGVINTLLLKIFGVTESIHWFTDAQFCKIPIIIFVIWVQLGFELIIYMAALQNVPKDLYEAADLDGVTPWKKFWKITFPLISPTTFYLLVVQFITVFKIFAAIDIMTFGNSAYANTSLVVEIYQNAVSNYKFGYASAEALVLLVFIVIITIINFVGQKKWVHY